ncbi:MAG: hypothetical protein FGM44_12195 [Limnohabitans sp.]|jgi:membrane protein implicated in regulation of membrane protease activity|nr:hypothetical protein [Limnohabitans sp.]
MDAYQVTLLIAIGLGLMELLLSAFLFLGMGLGALVVAAIQWLSGDWNLNRDLLIFAVCSTIAFLVFRRLFARPADQQAHHDDINRY